MDVRSTKDGHLIVMHDNSIDRTTTGTGKVAALTLAEIRSYKLKDPYGRISKETVPTFEEFLNVIKGKIMVDIDMKTHSLAEARAVVAAVQKTGAQDNVFYFMNNYDVLDEIKRLDKTAQLMPRAYSFHMADSAVAKYNPPIVHIDDSFYTDEVVEMLRKNSARILINALGKPDCAIRYGWDVEKVMEELFGKGANVVQTNEPVLFLKLLRERGLHK